MGENIVKTGGNDTCQIIGAMILLKVNKGYHKLNDTKRPCSKYDTTNCTK